MFSLFIRCVTVLSFIMGLLLLYITYHMFKVPKYLSCSPVCFIILDDTGKFFISNSKN